LLKRADDQRYAPAQYNLGFNYENCKGVTQNYKTAIKFYTKVAEQGSARAQFNLGTTVWRQSIRDHLAILPKRHICYF
jgi:TPR repeat protein